MLKKLLGLAVIGATCGGLLTFAELVTRDDIERNHAALANHLMQQMLSTDEPRPALLNDQPPSSEDCANGWFIRLQVDGFAGPIRALALWRPAQSGLSLRVSDHRETPGIGDFIDHRIDPWITQFDQARVAQWQQVDRISGATITSRAITALAEQGLAQVEDYCD